MDTKLIAQAIKQQKWLAIEYEKDDSISKFWIAIQDFRIQNKISLICDAFNFNEITNSTEGILKQITLNLEKIKKVIVLDNTTYTQSPHLIGFIQDNPELLALLKFDSFDHQLLNYFYECMKLEVVPYHTELTLVPEIDQEKLNDLPIKHKYSLSIGQMATLVSKIEKLSDLETKNYKHEIQIALNLLSIATSHGLFVVVYQKVNYNPLEKSLILDQEINFNYEFASDEFANYRHNLRSYLDMETEEFISLFLVNPKEAQDLLMNQLNKNESMDTRPYFFELKRGNYAYIQKEMATIIKRKEENNLNIPLEAFFGNMTKEKLRRSRKVDVVLIDNKINLPQLRVVYNSLIQPITYVQGPPGTGKTQTILNVIISSLFNNKTVLVSSNNNKPISDIYKKVSQIKYNKQSIPLPIIRLGNLEEIKKTLSNLKEVIEKYKNYPINELALRQEEILKKTSLANLNQQLQQYEERADIKEEISALIAMKKFMVPSFQGTIKLDALIAEKEEALKNNPSQKEEEILRQIPKVENEFLKWLFYSSIKSLQRIFTTKNTRLKEIIYLTDPDEQVKEFNKYLLDDDNLAEFQKIFPIILTTNQSAFRLGSQKYQFDLVILDEAGQCASGYALFPISRGEKLLLVGDNKQLQPVITIDPHVNSKLMKTYRVSKTYDYLTNSILMVMKQVDTISKFILLRGHYRSHPKIVNFSNQKFYDNQLTIDESKWVNAPEPLEFVNVKSPTTYAKERNINMSEAQYIVESIKKNHNKSSIGIITPFRNQARLIKKYLEVNNLSHIECGTVHTFQGAEKDTIYFSSGLTPKTSPKAFDWVRDNQELINVANTRAKNKFVFVGDYEEIVKRSPVRNILLDLANYVKKHGINVQLDAVKDQKIINSYNFQNYNSKKEEEFFETINHMITLGRKLKLANKVRVASILDKFTTPKKYDYGLKSEFDLVIFKLIDKLEVPVVAIEIDGEEHFTDDKVSSRDQLKEEICRDNGIRLVRIQNDYSRRYIFIKEILSDLLI